MGISHMRNLQNLIKISSCKKNLLLIFLLFFTTPSLSKNFTYSEGAIIRGDQNKKEIALVFTGDEYDDGAHNIINALRKEHIQASFFLSWNFYRNKNFASTITQL